MKWTLWLVVVLLATPAYAAGLRNPDVPFGFMAVDLFGGQSSGAKMEYHSIYSDAVYDTDVKRFGISFIVPAGRRATIIMSGTHDRDDLEGDFGQSYQLRLTTVDLRVRFYLGG